MAMIYKYRNISGRNYVHLPDGTLIDPGQTRWTYYNMQGNTSLELVESKDDGKTPSDAMVKEAISEYLEAHPESLNAAVADYISKHPGIMVGAGSMVEEGEDN